MTRINTPKEVLALAGSSAADKLQNTAGKTLILAFLAGAYIAIGGLFSLMAGFGFPGAAEAPGFQRLLSGAVFPLGLILVVFTGAELFTGNNAVLMPGALGRRYGWGKVARNWTLVWLGNFAGALFFTYFWWFCPACCRRKCGGKRPAILRRRKYRCRGARFSCAAWAPTGWYVWPYGSE